MPEKADPVSALREALQDIEDWLIAEADHPRPDPGPAMRIQASVLHAAISGEAPDRDGEVERIATMLRSMPWAGAAALYDAGLRAPSLEGARHPEAGETT